MNFKLLGKVERPEWYIDVAFRRAKEESSKLRSELKNKPRIVKSRAVELAKISTITASLKKHMSGILDSFPRIDGLADFYKALVRVALDYAELKHSLAAVKWVLDRITKLGSEYSQKIRKCRDFDAINNYRQEFYGRSASMMKAIAKELEFLEHARKVMKEFPSLKTSIETVVIAGFPNVGKTTLLRALTGSAPEVAPYPFTTKQLMLGYAGKLQFVDTPGLLDRPLEKRNRIELQAVLALKHLASKIVFVIDPSEGCGYPLKEQVALLKEIKASFRTPVIVVLNKADIAPKNVVEQLRKELGAIPVSAEKKQGIKELQALLQKP